MKNRKTLLHNISTTLVSTVLLLSSTLSRADDTDIFLSNPNYTSTIKPNVLFVLDNSGSMGWSLDYDSPPPASEKTRMDELKAAFSDVISNTSNINVGMMTLNIESGESSRLTFPITDIDANIGNSVVKFGAPEILESSDDAYERMSGNQVTTDSQVLLLGTLSSGNQQASIASNSISPAPFRITYPIDNFDGSYGLQYDTLVFNSSQYDDGLYYRDLGIPSGSVIEEAHVEFTAKNRDNGRFTSHIHADLSKSPLPFKLHQTARQSRNLTSAVTWFIHETHPEYQWIIGQKYKTPDLSTLIQSVLDDTTQNGQAGGNLVNLALIFDTVEGIRRVERFNKQEYNSGNDEPNSAKLYVKYNSPASYNGDFMTGLRFQNIGIPKGSVITKAELEFTAADTDNSSLSVEISAGIPDGNNNSPFAATDNNLSDRSHLPTKVTWDVPGWVKGSIDSPSRYKKDITPIISELVSHANWCGNESATLFLNKKNGTGIRKAHSIDGRPGQKPRLLIEYTPAESGCINETINTRIISENNDAYEWIENGYMYLKNNELRLSGADSAHSLVGLHYPRLPIVKNATILDASLELTSRDNRSGNMNIEIRAEDIGNSETMIPSYANISGRTSRQTSSKVDWNINDSWQQNATYQTPDIKQIIQEVVNRDNWEAGNNLTLILKPTGGERFVKSFEDNPTYSPRIRIRVASGGIDDSKGYKVRDHLLSVVKNMTAGGGTPIIPTMYNAATYYKQGFASKESPITNACQLNYMVLLTDGQANGNNATGAIRTLIGENQCDHSSSGERCGRDLSEWLFTTDLKPNLERQNSVATHTIAFATQSNATADTFMRDLATKGGGDFYTATNAENLAEAFNKAINDILANESSFAAPGVAANSYNRSEHLNKLYYSIFKPSQTDRWKGNLKKYQLLPHTSTDGSKSTEIFDAGVSDSDRSPALAIDSETGFFKERARSFWSTQDDGASIIKGGATSQLPTHSNQRRMYTYIGSSPAGTAANLDTNDHRLITGNSGLTPALLGLSSSDSGRKNELINWIRNPDTGLGDPLHSTPGLVNYRCNDTYSATAPLYCAEPKQQFHIFFGTNDGLFHGINAQTGKELFSFMPKELLPNLDKLEDNNSTNRLPGYGRPYGLDGHITLWANDVNGNGVIYGGADFHDSNNNHNTYDELSASTANPGEFVYAYFGMRRGGRNYYALDVTGITQDSDGNINGITPKMLWYILGGQGGFKRLGQTWSKPIRTKIKIAQEDAESPYKDKRLIDVLIFSGGYDPADDPSPLHRNSTMGNAIYIVNARTGSLIWSASGDSNDDNSTHTVELAGMNYSIPGGVTVADIEGDGIADQLFFGDTGGQVWRLFINNCKPNAQGNTSQCPVQNLNDTTGLVSATDGKNGIVASIGSPMDDSTPEATKRTNARKFFVSPDVALVAISGQSRMGIGIGSGNRPDPLGSVNGNVQDKFFMIYRPSLSTPTPSENPVSLSNLINKTPGTAGASSTNNNGWYLNMASTEKVMSDASIYQSKLYFNTYTPATESSDSCSAVAGQARGWTVDFYGNNVVTERLKSNGIVGKTVFVQLNNNDNTSTSGNSGTKTGVILRGTDTKQAGSPMTEGTTYWMQNM